MKKDRPEYVVCILRPFADSTTSWCDREVAREWHFTGLDHAAAARLKHDRLLPCPECCAVATRTLASAT